MSTLAVRCNTSIMGRIFGHKWWFKVPWTGTSYSTNYCTRCGFTP